MGYLLSYLALGAIFFLIGSTIVVTVYVMRSFGLYNMAKNRNAPNPWMAWIPIVSNYLSGSMVNQIVIQEYTIQNLALLNMVIPFIGLALANARFVGRLIMLASNLFATLVHYHLFKQYRSDSGVCLIYAIFPFMGFFKLRNEKPDLATSESII